MIYNKINLLIEEFMKQDMDDELETVKSDTQSSSAEVAIRRSDRRKVSAKAKHNSLDPLTRVHTLQDFSLPPMKNQVESTPLIVRKDSRLFVRKLFVKLVHDNLAPLIRTYNSKLPPATPHLLPPMKNQVESTALSVRKDSPLFVRKFFAKLLAPRIRTHYTGLPPATQHLLPPMKNQVESTALSVRKDSRLLVRKFFAKLVHDNLAPLTRTHNSELPPATEDPSGKTSLVPRKVFSQLACDDLAPKVAGGPRIRIVESEWTQAAHKPNVLEEVKVRKMISINDTQREWARKAVIPGKLTMGSFIRKTWPPISELPREATEITSEARGEDEPSFDELASWLDELQALVSEKNVSETPDVTTKTGFSQSSPHSSPQYPARPPASSWNPTSTRRRLKYSKMSFSTWSSKAANRNYATAAVSNN